MKFVLDYLSQMPREPTKVLSNIKINYTETMMLIKVKGGL